MVRSIGIPRERQQKNTLGIVTVISLLFQGVNLLFILLLLAAYLSLAGKEPAAMVQLESGRTIAIEPLDSGERTPAVIQSFAKDTMQLLFSASGAIANNGQTVPDTGVDVRLDEDKIARISTLANLASFALSVDFHPAFLVELAKRTPQEIFAQRNGLQLVLDVRDPSEPIPVPGKPHHWEVVVIANKVMLQGNQILSVTPFNRRVFVRSISIPSIHDYSSDIERQIAEIRRSGLEIYDIQPYMSGQSTSESDGVGTPQDSFIRQPDTATPSSTTP
jgi:hypothetical protein